MIFKGRGETVEDLVREIRRDLHRHPELGGEEERTSQLVQGYLQEWGIEVYAGFAKTGVLGVINPDSDGPTVALRADMDALPIQEKSAHDYVSIIPGKMHACGHDAHTAMLLGTAKLLKSVEDQLPGRVLLVFQPSEEVAPIGGAKPMMDDGVFNRYQPDAIFGQHVWPDLPVGLIGVREGAMMGASDRFRIVVTGKGGHASMPHQTVDTIAIANQVYSALQTIVSRNVDPLESAVVTVGRITGGYRYNVIAESVELEGTIRTFKPEVKRLVKERFFTIVENVVKAMGGTVQIDYWDGYPATINTLPEAKLVATTAQSLLGEDATPAVPPSLGGEDFSRFLEKYSGAFLWLGCGFEDPELNKPLHDSSFELNEACLPVGVELMAQTAFNFLQEKKMESKTYQTRNIEDEVLLEKRGTE